MFMRLFQRVWEPDYTYTVIPEINAWLKYCESVKFKGFNKNAILLIRKQGIPVYDHYKMFKNRNYNNVSQKRLAKFALIKYFINIQNYVIPLSEYLCQPQ